MVQTELTEWELINFVYKDIAGEIIRVEVNDFSDYRNWWAAVNKMAEPVRLVYRIGILNLQVMNGGLIQYFDNGYGIFAYDTLQDLNRIEATLTQDILNEAVTKINHQELKDVDYYKFILNQEYHSKYDEIGDYLDRLDNRYYELEDQEDLAKMIGKYLRTNKGK